MVNQPARRRNDQIQWTLKRLVLCGIGLTAQHANSFHLFASKDIPRDIPQLFTQLPRR